MKYVDIVERISYFRTQKGMSARVLSLTIGKDEGYIGKLESKQFTLPSTVLLDILEVLEVSPAEFFADNYQSFAKDKELLDLFKTLPSEKKDSIMNLIKK